MYTFLLVLLIIDSVVLIAVVLLQAGKGSGLAANFGGSSSSTDAFVGTRQAANLLTKASWWLAGSFMVIAYLLSLAHLASVRATSVLDQVPGSQRTPPASPSRQPTANLPLTPAPTTTPAPTAPAPATTPPAKSPKP